LAFCFRFRRGGSASGSELLVSLSIFPASFADLSRRGGTGEKTTQSGGREN
jgi:hypothetical protein